MFTSAVSYQKLDYVHNNPCTGKWQLAIEPSAYTFSSASFYELGENRYSFLKRFKRRILNVTDSYSGSWGHEPWRQSERTQLAIDVIIDQSKKMSEMQKNASNKTVRIFLILGGIVLFSFLYDQYRKRNLDENARYIYGKFYDISPAKNGAFFDYYYNYEGQTFKGTYKALMSSYRKDDLVLIKFQTTDPQIHELLYDYKFMPTFDSSYFPSNGWDTLPTNIIFKRK